ncbi:MAG: GerAB/ArcD/ProY family transporter [Firmicutes bacterium]|jgi:spore germination protein|nr:GerAB/ArcD/ProY family transporter [Bacillota bacterium]NLL88218.1 GerAB/ArcD/ProY family transporter [Bacillota bacterium]
MSARDKLLTQEVPVIIINMIYGIGTITLPSLLARSAGPDGIIAYLAAVAVYIIGTVLIILLVQRFPNHGLADYSPMLLGTVPGFAVNLLFTLYLIFLVSAVMRAFAEVTKFFLLPRTPIEAIMLSMLFTTSILARNGLQPIARACQIILYVFFIPFLVIPLFVSVFDTGEFLPLFQEKPAVIAKAAYNSIFSLTGVEIMLVLGSHSENSKRLMRPALIGVAIVLTMILIAVVLAFGSLSVDQTAKLTDPLFEMIKYVPVPYSILERIDISFYTVWIAATYSTLVIGLFTASHHVAEIFKLDNGKGFVFPLAAVVYFLALIPKNENEVLAFNIMLGAAWLALTFGLVPLLLVLSKIRNPKGAKKQMQQPQKKNRKANP